MKIRLPLPATSGLWSKIELQRQQSTSLRSAQHFLCSRNRPNILPLSSYSSINPPHPSLILLLILPLNRSGAVGRIEWACPTRDHSDQGGSRLLEWARDHAKSREHISLPAPRSQPPGVKRGLREEEEEREDSNLAGILSSIRLVALRVRFR